MAKINHYGIQSAPAKVSSVLYGCVSAENTGIHARSGLQDVQGILFQFYMKSIVYTRRFFYEVALPQT